jgi:hypothetical protein
VSLHFFVQTPFSCSQWGMARGKGGKVHACL